MIFFNLSLRLHVNEFELIWTMLPTWSNFDCYVGFLGIYGQKSNAELEWKCVESAIKTDSHCILLSITIFYHLSPSPSLLLLP